jgi:AcrR family transcriptional regulator
MAKSQRNVALYSFCMAPRKAQEIFTATLELLAEEGYEGLTIEGVADRSGVNKTTIYRWWRSKQALLGAALTDARLLEIETPDTGSLREDLRVLVQGIAALLTEPPGSRIAVAALAAAAHHPELAAVTQIFFADRMSREEAIFQRAVERGELDADIDSLAVMDLLAGAVWIRAVFRGLPLDATFVDQAVNAVLDGVRPRAR